MCLVLELDNGKVVSIAHEQNHRQTELQTESCQHPVPYYYIDILIECNLKNKSVYKYTGCLLNTLPKKYSYNF